MAYKIIKKIKSYTNFMLMKDNDEFKVFKIVIHFFYTSSLYDYYIFKCMESHAKYLLRSTQI